MGGLKVGEIIRELRGRNGISQETLADVCGISMQAVSRWKILISSLCVFRR